MGEKRELNIRKLFPFDIDTIYPLLTDLICKEVPELESRADFFLHGDYTKDRVQASLGFHKNAIFGAYEGEELIGFIWGNACYAGLGFISWLIVKEDNRNNGVGAKLLNYYEDFIKSRNGHVVELYCFEALKKFYEKNGYEVIGIREKGYFGLKQYIMDKQLTV